MVWLLVVLVGALAVILVAPASRLGRYAHRMLVEAPAAWLERLQPRRLIVWAIVLSVIVLLGHFAPQFAPALAGMGDIAPIIALLADGSLTLELVLALWLAAASGAGAAAFRLIHTTLRRVSAATTRFARRGARARRQRKPRLPKSRDDLEPGQAFA